jgi:hypothetical protein
MVWTHSRHDPALGYWSVDEKNNCYRLDWYKIYGQGAIMQGGTIEIHPTAGGFKATWIHRNGHVEKELWTPVTVAVAA